MRAYRLYLLDASGRISRAPIIIEALTDQDAVEAAEAQSSGGPMELWLLDKLIHRFEGRRQQA